jgi:hypothetical protein
MLTITCGGGNASKKFSLDRKAGLQRNACSCAYLGWIVV